MALGNERGWWHVEGVSLSLNKTGRQPGGRQPTKEEVANEDYRKDALD